MYFNHFNFPPGYPYRQIFPMPPGPPIGAPFDPSSGPPSGPPPSFTPDAEPQLKAVDPGAIKPCKYRYVYIWLDNGRSFWAWLVYVGKDSVAGWRWDRFRWVYFGIDLDKIDSFVCY